MADRQPKYTISIVSEIVGLHEQSLRMYERRGLIRPQRSGGNIRLFSDEDVERVRAIQRLVNDLGVNLAGAEVILHMREQMDAMRQELERLRQHLEDLSAPASRAQER
jgi:MerR family transcriptional regulator/heat shock protein HspR